MDNPKKFNIDSKIDKCSLDPEDADSFRVWIIRMKMYLRTLEIAGHLENDMNPHSFEFDSFQRDDRLTRHILMSHLSDTAVLKVYKVRSAKEMWSIIMNEYAKVIPFLIGADSDVTLHCFKSYQ